MKILKYLISIIVIMSPIVSLGWIASLSVWKSAELGIVAIMISALSIISITVGVAGQLRNIAKWINRL